MTQCKLNDPIISTHSDCFNKVLGHGGGTDMSIIKQACYIIYNTS